MEKRLMKIVLTSVLVDDQEKALRFYRDVLGFQLKPDFPPGRIAGSPSSLPSSRTGWNWFSSPMNIRRQSHSSRRWSRMEFPARPSASRMFEASTRG